MTTPKANIFDMGGNAREFTTELIPNAHEDIVLRGGGYAFFDTYSAGFRADDTVIFGSPRYGFRSTLFLK